MEARAAAQQRAAEEAGVMGAADGGAKVNRDAFRAGGGSSGDLDRLLQSSQPISHIEHTYHPQQHTKHEHMWRTCSGSAVALLPSAYDGPSSATWKCCESCALPSDSMR